MECHSLTSVVRQVDEEVLDTVLLELDDSVVNIVQELVDVLFSGSERTNEDLLHISQ